MEERSVPSILAVTSLADSGVGTLRQAITTADAGATTNSYDIDIETPGTITLKTVLPDQPEHHHHRSRSGQIDRATGFRRFPLPHLYG